jgi:UDP-N-acetylmuramyl pentapeptide phosphotransferase/UDP-N-acetylglucosamine-1-phosphate transferase
MSKKEIIIVVSIILSIYLGMSFIAMEINPAKWHVLARLFYMIIAVCALAVTFLDDNFKIKRSKDM